MTDLRAEINFDTARFADLARVEDDPAWIESIVRQFISDCRPRPDLLAEAEAAGDAQTFAAIAHALQGSSATLGAQGIVSIAARLQDLGRRGELEGCGPLLTELRRMVDLTIQYLETDLLSGRGPE